MICLDCSWRVCWNVIRVWFHWLYVCVCFSFFVIDVLSDDTFNGKQITEGCRDAVRACVERSTNSEGRIVEVNAFADFFSKSFGKSYSRPDEKRLCQIAAKSLNTP